MTYKHATKDYFENTILFQYDGLFDYAEMVEYLKKCYGSDMQKGFDVIEHGLPSGYKGFRNLGFVIIKIEDHE